MGNTCSHRQDIENIEIQIRDAPQPDLDTGLEGEIEDQEVFQENSAPLRQFIEQRQTPKSVVASNNLQFHTKRPRKPTSKSPAHRHSAVPNIEANRVDVRTSLPPSKMPNFEAKDRVIPRDNRSSFSNMAINQDRFIHLRTEEIKQFYALEECVGEGSFGSVYRARCLRTQEDRAIKVVKRSKLGTKKDQLFAELELLKRLDHPNIIKLYEVFEAGDRFLIVTEFCKGGSIIDFIKGRKEVSEGVMKVIMKQLLGCLNYLHKLNIVHRDIKLQNVVFLDRVRSKEGSDVEIKLIDFGTAVKMTRTKMNTRNLVGTLSYMAPQIIKGYYTERCDIWSCGVILYILLTSESPFRHKQKAVTIENILKKEPRYDGRIWHSVSPEALQLVRLMLVKTPYQRASAQQCLTHPWFDVQEEEELSQKDGAFVESLRNYYRQNNFLTVLESYLLFARTSQAERQRISTIFKQIDKNSDGEIEISELVTAYKEHFPSDTSEAEIENIVKKVDKDLSGRISFAEFTSVMVARDKIFVREAVDEAFDFFDQDKTGFIEKEELMSLLKGTEMKEVEDLLTELDVDKDSRISRDEFMQYLVEKGCLY